jgi:multiple antibiotic resistance protein
MLWDIFAPVDTGSFGQALVVLLLILDPLGDIPVFLSVTAGLDKRQRAREAYLAAAVAAAVVLVSALLGDVVIAYLGLSLEALLLSGGILLLLLGLERLRGQESLATPGGDAHVALVPLGTPMLAGPAAVVATMVLMRQSPVGAGRAGVIGGVVVALAAVALCLRQSSWGGRYLRPAAIAFISRLMGLLLLAVGVQLMVKAAMRWVRLGLG